MRSPIVLHESSRRPGPRWSRPGSPFVGAPRGMRSATWVEPRLEAEVSYAEIVEGAAPRAKLAGTA